MHHCRAHLAFADRCLGCWLAANDRSCQRALGLPVTAPAVRPPMPDWVPRNRGTSAAGRSQPAPCIHRGDPTGERRPCPTCTGTVMVPLLQCALHGTCTTGLLLPGVKCCRICIDRPTK